MNFNKHSSIIKNQHAFLSPSNYHWINYDDQKVSDTYFRMMAVKMGTELHEFAASCIRLSQKLPNLKKTLNLYVNDAIGFKMNPEQTLVYSENCFGTADAISFRDNILRIHDLKTGSTKTHIEQLLVYSALFCLEYRLQPDQMEIELRIYQSNEIIYHKPEVDEIIPIMDKIITFDKIINKIKSEEE